MCTELLWFGIFVCKLCRNVPVWTSRSSFFCFILNVIVNNLGDTPPDPAIYRAQGALSLFFHAWKWMCICIFMRILGPTGPECARIGLWMCIFTNNCVWLCSYRPAEPIFWIIFRNWVRILLRIGNSQRLCPWIVHNFNWVIRFDYSCVDLCPDSTLFWGIISRERVTRWKWLWIWQ